MQFVPDNQAMNLLDVPCFEDATADYAPYYASGSSPDKAKEEVAIELSKLGASLDSIQSGSFDDAGRKRYGYVIRFRYSGGIGEIKVAGLPICQRETDIKINKVRVQALLNVRDWLKASVTSRIFSPGNEPLLPYMLADGVHTIMELIQMKNIALLPAPANIQIEVE